MKKYAKLQKRPQIKAESNDVKKSRRLLYGGTKVKTGENPHEKVEFSEEIVKKSFKYEKIDVLHVNIKYPQIKRTENAVLMKRFNRFYKSAVEAFIKYCEKKLYPNASEIYLERQGGEDVRERFRAFGAVAVCGVTYSANGYICTVGDINIYSGAGRGSITRRVRIWETQTAAIYNPRKFISFGTEDRARVAEYISGMMHTHIRNGEERYIETEKSRIFELTGKNNYYLTDKGFAFFYEQNTVSPKECGIPSFIIPEKFFVLRGESAAAESPRGLPATLPKKLRRD